MLNMDPTRQPVLDAHRCGWAWALRALEPLHDRNGVLFDSFLERSFCWFARQEMRYRRIPYREPWVGILHNPPGVPIWHDYQNSPQEMLRSQAFQDSLDFCCGLFVLSKYLRDWLANQVNVPVAALIHPTETQVPQFDFAAYERQTRRRVVQVGWWLRKLTSIYRLPARRMEKAMLCIGHGYFAQVLERERKVFPVAARQFETVKHIDFLNNELYDALLSQSIVFCDLFDSSANNTVIECIARATPLLVNPLPAVLEYLGDEYPFYFASLEEAAVKAEDLDLVHKTHRYLANLDKTRFQQQHFREELAASAVYQQLPEASRTRQQVICGPDRHLNARFCDPVLGPIESEISVMRSPSGQVIVGNVVVKISDGVLSSQLSNLANQELRGKRIMDALRIVEDGFLKHCECPSTHLRKRLASSFQEALSSFR